MNKFNIALFSSILISKTSLFAMDVDAFKAIVTQQERGLIEKFNETVNAIKENPPFSLDLDIFTLSYEPKESRVLRLMKSIIFAPPITKQDFLDLPGIELRDGPFSFAHHPSKIMDEEFDIIKAQEEASKDLNTAMEMKKNIPLEQGRFLDPIIKNHLQNQSHKEQNMLAIKDLFTIDPACIDNDMLQEFQVWFFQKITSSPTTDNFNILQELLFISETKNMAQGFLTKFLQYKYIQKWQQPKLALNIQTFMHNLADEDLKTRIQAQARERFYSCDVALEEKNWHIYQIGIFDVPEQLAMISYILNCARNEEISQIQITPILDILLDIKNDQITKLLAEFIKEKIMSSSLSWEEKNWYFKNIESCDLLQKSNIVHYVLDQIESKNITHAQFIEFVDAGLSGIAILEAKRPLLEFITKICISPDIAWTDKRHYINKAHKLLSSSQKKIIEHVMDSARNNLISNEELSQVVENLSCSFYCIQKPDFYLFLYELTKEENISVPVKTIFLRAVRKLPDLPEFEEIRRSANEFLENTLDEKI